MADIDAAAAIRTHVRAFNQGELDALLAGMTEDAVWITGATVARGRAELVDLFGGAITGLRPTLTIDSMLTGGDRVACQLTETLTFGGQERTFSIAAFFVLRDGRIHTAKIYREGSAELS